MKARSEPRGVTFPSPSQDDMEHQFTELVLEEEEDAPCSEYVVMSQERHMPALQEYLHELHVRGGHAFQ